jgi:capsular exopolysaccharide synthesis family protein
MKDLERFAPIHRWQQRVRQRLLGGTDVSVQPVHLYARAVGEAFGSIRTSLLLGQAQSAHTILVTSPMSGDGKSITASHLAIAFARHGCRTLLLDCDLRDPIQHLIFRLDSDIGLSSVLTAQTLVEDAIQPTWCPGLDMMACGPVPKNPSDLLAGPDFNQLLTSLSEKYDRVIIDSPPLGAAADARILAASSDATLLVLRMNLSARASSVEAVSSLKTAGARLVGAIANGTPPEKPYPYGSQDDASSIGLAWPVPETKVFGRNSRKDVLGKVRAG